MPQLPVHYAAKRFPKLSVSKSVAPPLACAAPTPFTVLLRYVVARRSANVKKRDPRLEAADLREVRTNAPG